MKQGREGIQRSALAALTVIAMIVSGGCNYGRMNDQEDVKTYERKMPAMDKRTMPVKDGFATLSHANPQSLKNPLSYSDKSVGHGRLAYKYFCAQCHGQGLDGRGTVGQSFVPLPADLASLAVQSQSDGELYAKVRLGFKRHPKLFTTISAEDAWAVIIYMRSVRSPS